MFSVFANYFTDFFCTTLKFTIMEASERINQLLNYLDISAATLAVNLGKSRPQFIYDIQKGKTKNISQDLAKQIVSVYPEINDVWLITGNGQMLIEKEKQYREAKGMVLPLVPFTAMGGYNEDNWTAFVNSCPLYAVPDINIPADFLIKVGGDSMYPVLCEGDLLVCRMIQELLFFQWGKTYVIDTSQGVMVKNVYEDKENPDNILLVSENSEKYPPFAIPRKDIRKIALVVGSLRIRLEM
jgi:SOS-response transcriptional repressor LexA